MEREIVHERVEPSSFERELAPGVYLRQEEEEGQFVEIVLPVFEMHQLVRECERDFPQYAITLCQAAVERNPQSITPETKFTPEILQGMLNTQILGTALSRNPSKRDTSIGVISDLEQAFVLAMKGRLRLTADPLSWKGELQLDEFLSPTPNLGPP